MKDTTAYWRFHSPLSGSIIFNITVKFWVSKKIFSDSKGSDSNPCNIHSMRSFWNNRYYNFDWFVFTIISRKWQNLTIFDNRLVNLVTKIQTSQVKLFFFLIYPSVTSIFEDLGIKFSYPLNSFDKAFWLVKYRFASKSSHSQMLFKIDLRKSFAIFTGKYVCCNSF